MASLASKCGIIMVDDTHISFLDPQSVPFLHLLLNHACIKFIKPLRIYTHTLHTYI